MPEFLFAVPFLGRTFLSLIVILAVQKLTKSLGWALLTGIAVITVYGLIFVFLPEVGRYDKYLSMVVGVFCALGVLQLQRPSSARTWRTTVLSSHTVGLAVIVMLSRVYGAFIEAKLPGGSSSWTGSGTSFIPTESPFSPSSFSFLS